MTILQPVGDMGTYCLLLYISYDKYINAFGLVSLFDGISTFVGYS